MAYVAPTTRADGYVVDAAEWNKNTVDNPIALRSGAIAIASQAANDIVYASSSTQFARLAAGTAGQLLQTNGAGSAPTWVNAAAADPALCSGRLSLTTATPVTTGDVTAAGTLYWTPYKGNRISLYSGSAWVEFAQAELSIAVPAAANQTYDAFVDYNAGTPALSLTAWTNDTTRATALTKQDGVLVLTGTLGKRYVGTVRTVTASQLNDSLALRHVWNHYHRLPRLMRVLEATNSWNYTTATVRQANGAATNQLDFVVGVAEDPIDTEVVALASNDGGGVAVQVGIAIDSTTVVDVNCTGRFVTTGAANAVSQVWAKLRTYPAVGRHVATWLEYSVASGTTTWQGDNGGLLMQAGISGVIHG